MVDVKNLSVARKSRLNLNQDCLIICWLEWGIVTLDKFRTSISKRYFQKIKSSRLKRSRKLEFNLNGEVN